MDADKKCLGIRMHEVMENPEKFETKREKT